jgi:cytochrome c peroxidase
MHSFVMRTVLVAGVFILPSAAFSDSLPPDASYRPLPSQPFSVVRAADEAQKPAVMRRQAELLQARYDLSDRPMPGVFCRVAAGPSRTGCESSFRRA